VSSIAQKTGEVHGSPRASCRINTELQQTPLLSDTAAHRCSRCFKQWSKCGTCKPQYDPNTCKTNFANKGCQKGAVPAA
jgi:hypothetical protein